MKAVHFLVASVFLALAFSLAYAFDPSPLQDFCVAINDTKNGVFVNGKFCQDPKLATPDDFFFPGLNIPRNTDNPVGSTVTQVNVVQILGLNTLGISLARIDFAPYGGLNPPHIHPRATEILVVLEGTLYVGFVTSNPENKLFTKVLNKGDVFVFPIGLIHFQLNIGKTKAVVIAALSSQNPGVITIANALFKSDPAINPDVLSKAFQLDQNIVKSLKLEGHSLTISLSSNTVSRAGTALSLSLSLCKSICFKTNKNSMIPSPSTPQNPNPNIASNPSDLSTTLASLKTLLSLSHQTLQNHQFLPPKSPNDQFVPCPYNPHHLMPPESLFLHTLRCPVPLSVDPPNYQTTLHTSSYLHQQRTNFTLQDFTEELCFSIDDYFFCSGYSSFFYKDCPAVVSLSDVDASSASSSSKKAFTLPGFLSVECANVVCCDGTGAKGKLEGFGEVGLKVLGSDLWFIRREIEGWNDYEYVTVCSFNVVCAILGLKMVRECVLKKWIVVNSPRYGVVIDVYMRDHIFVLVVLCLKAVVREALGFVELAKGWEMEKGLKSRSFKCPLLTQALTWLASQLSVLYGNVNGKLFAVSIFKNCVLESASRLLFSWDQNLTESFDLERDHKSLHLGDNNIQSGKAIEPLESSAAGREGETVDSKVVFVSQVAAVIAALYERSWLEEKIRALRVSQPLTSYQRMAEHAYVSNRADEERKRRPNYIPIIEHDGLPWQRSSNQETNKTKTREELLAEERDYKRRRMSYRGKKVKRTTVQVMRDIIEEYMEEIKQAGGIGCFEKRDEDGETFSSKLSAYDRDADDDGKSKSDSFQATRSGPNYNRKQSQHDYNFESTAVEDALPRNHEQSRRRLLGHHEHLKDLRGSADREKYGREYCNSSSERHRSHDRSYDRSGHKREREDVELTRHKHTKIKRSSSSRSNFFDGRSSYPVSNSRQRNTHDSSAASCVPNAFEDRYDPSESHDWYEYDVVNRNSDIRPE